MQLVKYALWVLVFAGVCLPGAVHAELDANGQREVAELLAFVGHSHCVFVRNGSSYTATEAQAHLQDKLNYLVRRNLVGSAEQFIERAASQSSISGKPYEVNCAGKQRLSSEWLQEELQRLRQAQP